MEIGIMKINGAAVHLKIVMLRYTTYSSPNGDRGPPSAFVQKYLIATSS